jgi:hypothetical protein
MFNPNQAFLLVQKLKKIGPKGFTLGVKAEIEKNKIFSIYPKLLINAEILWPCISPQGWKKKGGPKRAHVASCNSQLMS